MYKILLLMISRIFQTLHLSIGLSTTTTGIPILCSLETFWQELHSFRPHFSLALYLFGTLYHTAFSLSLSPSPCYHLPHSPPPILMYFFPSLLLPLPPPTPPTHFLPRLELQVSSLEREVESKQQALMKTESQLAKYEPTPKQPMTKYKPTSKQEVLKKLRENIR